jgi:UDP-glucose 4-epimerase
MALRQKTALVTGSDGFVGRLLAARLEEKGVRVTGFDVTRGRDVARWSDFSRIRRVDVVYHLAARTFVPAAQKEPRTTYQVNVSGTVNALEFARRRGARFVFASSYVYGNPGYLPIDEKHPVSPTNPYATSKLVGETLCQAYHRDFGVACVVLRPFNIYGAGQDERFLIPEIVRQLKRGRTVTLKDLTPRRDVLYVDDAVEAYVKAGEYGRPGCEVFNVGFGRSYSVREIAEKLISLSGRDVTLRSRGERRKGEIRDTVADVARAKRRLKWKPLVGIDEGLRRVLEA